MKHFYICHEYFTHSAIGAAPEPRPPDADRLYSSRWSIWTVSKLPARPRGRWTCSPSLPPMALTARSYRSRRLYQPPLATAKAISVPQRQTIASSPARESHGVMPNSRPVPSRKSAPESRKTRSDKVFRWVLSDGIPSANWYVKGLILLLCEIARDKWCSYWEHDPSPK